MPTPTPLRTTHPRDANGWKYFWKAHRVWDFVSKDKAKLTQDWHVTSVKYPHMTLSVSRGRWTLRSGYAYRSGKCRDLPDALRRAYALATRTLVAGFRAEWTHNRPVYRWDPNTSTWVHVANMTVGWPNLGDGLYVKVCASGPVFSRVRGSWQSCHQHGAPHDPELSAAMALFPTVSVTVAA